MTLEQYILKRKLEDGIDEFDLNSRAENTRICVNYIFEFFNDYIESADTIEQSVMHEDKLDKYRKQIDQYDGDVQDWLVSLYAAHGKYMHRHLIKLIDEEPYFLLYTAESEYRSLSYKIYANIVKKFKFMESQAEMIYVFIKNYHRLASEPQGPQLVKHITDEIDEWVINTYEKYGVNLIEFCRYYLDDFHCKPESWPKGSKHKSDSYDDYVRWRKEGFPVEDWCFWKYDYKWQVNPFGIDKLYRNMPKKEFTKNHKKDFVTLFVYDACESEKDYKYWEKFSANLK